MQLSPQRLQEIGVTTATVERRDVNNELSVPGNVDIDEEKLSYVQTRFPGWIQDVSANATYQYVRKGQRLFTIYSPDIVSSEQEYLLARQNQKAFAPDAQGMGVRKRLAPEGCRGDGCCNSVFPRRRSRICNKSGKVQRDIAIDSPASGYIMERNALPNAYVQPEMKLYTIADLSTVWVYANVFQNDVGRLKPGDSAQVTVDAYPGRNFNGRIDQILPQVDHGHAHRTGAAGASQPWSGLKPGMYVNVAISVPLGRQLVIPATAVLQTGTRALCLSITEAAHWSRARLRSGRNWTIQPIVLSGLKAGEKVVSSANFLVDSEAQLQAAVGAYAPVAPQTGRGRPGAADGDRREHAAISTAQRRQHGAHQADWFRWQAGVRCPR
jgi:multidrug efflux pump subunit AcrA (membrane-fusion protein)